MAAYRRVYDSHHLRLTAKNRDQLRNPTLRKPVRATFTFFAYLEIRRLTDCTDHHCTLPRACSEWSTHMGRAAWRSVFSTSHGNASTEKPLSSSCYSAAPLVSSRQFNYSSGEQRPSSPSSKRQHRSIGNESVPIQLAQYCFPGLAISNDKI